MSASVGRVNLDIGLNQKSLQKEIRGMGSTYKKDFQSMGKSLGKSFGGTLSVAFGNMISGMVQTALKSIGSFISSSIELGSSIAELENVTSTVFPTMTSQLENFSKTALQQYGLTEMQTKKMMGTFGAMAQSFNYTEAQSYAMSESLTGLVGDVASFYNLDHDVAYTKIKSVFTGETESLKELGIVMTQTALDEYAMQKGMGKTVQQMTEQEKVALRLAFVTDKLSFAAGDFNKTQHQWANQTRILSGQWDSFKAALGQGFIAVLTPVIQGLNEVMAVVVKLGEKFRDFMMLITGNKGASSGSGALMTEIADVTTAAADTAETASGQASSAAKEVKKSLMGFDKLNKLSDQGNSSGSGGSTISTPTSTPALGDTEKSANSVMGSLDGLKKKLEEIINTIANWTGLDKLWSGIELGIKKVDFSSIKTNFESIFSSLQPIVESTFNGIGTIMRSVMNFVGTTLGELIAVGGKYLEIGTGGVAQFLETEKGNISSWVTETANTIATGYDNLSFAAENIFGSLWTALDENKAMIETSISNILGAFSTAGMTIGTIFYDMWEGLTKGFADFTVEHQADIDEFFNGTIESWSLLSDSLSNIFGGIFESLNTWWQEDGKRIWNEIVGVFGDLVGWVMKIWNEWIKPVIDNISKELNRLWEESLKPLWDEILKLITSVWDHLKLFWDGWIKPLIDWLVDTLGPIFTSVFNNIVNIISIAIGIVIDVVKGLIKSLRGIIDFVTGVFTGDWKKAWEGIKTFFGGIWDAIWGVIKGVINLIINGLNGLWNGLYAVLRGIINGVGTIFKGIGELFGQDWGWSIPKNAPQIPRLAEGGYVRANQPQLAMIGDNKRHGEIVAPEDKLYEIVSAALQAFMGQLIAALNSGRSTQRDSDMMQLIIQLGEETIINRIIKRINAESRRQGTVVIKA